jgi:hypothetical protein
MLINTASQKTFVSHFHASVSLNTMTAAACAFVVSLPILTEIDLNKNDSLIKRGIQSQLEEQG